jgi:hypothetical protein
MIDMLPRLAAPGKLFRAFPPLRVPTVRPHNIERRYRTVQPPPPPPLEPIKMVIARASGEREKSSAISAYNRYVSFALNSLTEQRA